jgi:hypothetical protein
MKNILIIGVAAMLLSNTFQLRTNARIAVANVLEFSSNAIHPYRSY